MMMLSGKSEARREFSSRVTVQHGSSTLPCKAMILLFRDCDVPWLCDYLDVTSSRSRPSHLTDKRGASTERDVL